MKTHLIHKILLAALLALPSFARTSEPYRTAGEITDATVYRGQALVTREIQADLVEGMNEIIVTDLPTRVIGQSLFAQSRRANVLSVRYRQLAVTQDTHQEVQQLREQIEQVQDQKYQLERDQTHIGLLREKYQSLWQLSVNISNADFNKALLNPDSLLQLAEDLEAKLSDLHTQAVELEFKQQEADKQLEHLNRQLESLKAGRSQTRHDAVLFVNAESAGDSTIELHYLVSGASWIPQYNLRADEAQDMVTIEYNAVVNQVSGEDWTNVALSLSTAEPAMVASAPILEPMKVSLADAQQAKEFFDRGEQEEFGVLIQQRQDALSRGFAAQAELREIATKNQILELNAAPARLEQDSSLVGTLGRIEGVSATYPLMGRPSLPSRTDQHLVNIATHEMSAEFVYVANPVMTDYIYLQGSMENTSDIVFLPGKLSVFRDGQFAGQAEMPLVAEGESFSAGFGVDSQLQCLRKLTDKNTRYQGGNRIDTYSYELMVNSYKAQPVQLRLLDRLPYTEDSAIRIALDDVSPELSDDSQYLASDYKKGLLRWDIEVAEQQAVEVSYSYQMEYDRNMSIAGN